VATKSIEPGNRKGIVQVPPSKSDAQRAILCAGLSKGKSLLAHVGQSADERSMLDAITALGAEVIKHDDGNIAIVGIETIPSEVRINANESGLGARLLTAVCSAGNGPITVIGSGSLSSRPMHFFGEVLPKFGVKITEFTGHLPITVHGPMHGNNIEMDGSLSSQFVSGLLMALPLAHGDSQITVLNLASKPYVNMTLSTLAAFGITITRHENDTFHIAGGQQYQATDYAVEGDWSAASCWLTAAALGADISIKGLSPSSAQADKQMLAALMSAGCSVHFTPDGIRVNGSKKRPFEFNAQDCPDLFPALVALAAHIPGISIIQGANRLIHKESNRAEALILEFFKLGVLIEHKENALYIHGKSSLLAMEVDAHNDHRIAMALGVCGLFAPGPITIHGSESVSKSYPSFWDTLDSLAH
jgi:3-phosphoshikimate 1-carboxyvinyltransferase